MNYIASMDVRRITRMGSYNFTLISATQNWFESVVSTVFTKDMNNTAAKCSDIDSEETVTIRTAGFMETIMNMGGFWLGFGSDPILYVKY